MSLVEWGKLNWAEAKEAVASHSVALLPIGAVEQHGPHLPLDTDNVAAEALARRLADRADLVLLPPLPYGQVWSLRRFPGSLTVSTATLVQFLKELLFSLREKGFGAVVVLSCHLGNLTAMKQAAREVYDESGFLVSYLFYPGLKEAAAGVLESPQSHGSIVHADELETSILLALSPESVRMDRAVAEYPDYPEDFDVQPFYWDEVSETGVFGDATKASAEKGEAVLSHVIERSVEIIERLKARVPTGAAGG